MANYWVFIKNFSLLVAFVIINLLSLCIFHAFLVEEADPVVVCRSDDSDYISDEINAGHSGLRRSGRLARAVQFKTVTYAPKNYEKEELSKLVNFISESFPKIHSATFITKEVINNFSLLYTVKGTDSSLKPYMLCAHLDVVPVEEEKWEENPFEGKIKDGYIWGRGTIDCKHTLMGSLEALEFMLEKGFQPHRSFYLAFGHDEEGGGLDGAAYIAEVLMSRGVKLEYLLDEGTFILKNIAPSVQVPIALVSVTEKGSMNLQLEVKTTPGHSSIPPRDNAIVILSQALSKFSSTVFPSMLGKGPEYAYVQAVAPYASFPFKIVYSNIWLLKPLLSWMMSYNNLQNAFIRTTAAVTVVKGGLKDNILPSSATAIVNHRIHSAQSVQEVFHYIKNIINDDRVQMKIISSFEPHPLSPFSKADFGFMTIKNSIRQIIPASCVAPALLVANTDCRWYLNLTDAVYRFSPVNLYPHETARFHGHNERISVENYIQVINFFYHLIKNSDETELKYNQKSKDEL